MNFISVNPFTQEKIADFELENSKNIEKKLQIAEKAFLSWKKIGLNLRIDLALNLAQKLEENKTKLAQAISSEMGKTYKESLAELEKCYISIRYFALNCETYLKTQTVISVAKESFFSFEPTGCILAIMPWNFPFWQALRFAIPSILTGNVVMLKHAPNVQICANLLEKMFLEAGFGNGVFQNICIDIPLIEQIISSKIVTGVTLTGSSIAGASVASLAGKHLKKSVLELGGSDPFIVLEDADLQKAAKMAVKSRFQNAGQTCIAAKRWIVTEKIYENFVEEVIKSTKNIICGDPFHENTIMGPMARIDLAEKLNLQKKNLIKNGGIELLQSNQINCLVSPGILEISRELAYSFSEEIFGPIACIIKAKNENEAVEIANETTFGLGASVWTADIEKAKVLGYGIDSGSIFINSMVKSDASLPFGGTKASGYGRELGAIGFHEFANIKSFWVEEV
jgi:succinate-semialdehyde dehydrogenase/glutarate-semialdehyde dehydrogenase